MVAAWHETSKGEYIRLKNEKDIDPRKWILIKPVTEDMVREFLSTELEPATQVPIVGLERLPSEKPNERVYKITTGPSAEPRAWPIELEVGLRAKLPGTAPLGVMLHLIQDNLLSSIGGLLVILIAVIITSFFIPNMLRPGSVVMLLSKPIGRTTLLLFKYWRVALS